MLGSSSSSSTQLSFRDKVLAALVGAAGLAKAQTLYGANGAAGNASTNLFTIDPTSGAATTIGPIGFAVTGLAFNPLTGTLYGSTGNQSPASPGSLITINPSTGAGTLVGPFGLPGQTMADLTFTSNGTLFGWLEPTGDDLYTINLATGAGTLVADSGLNTSGSGIAANTSNTLFFAGSGSSGALRTIDSVTGQPTTVATLSGSPVAGNVSALAFDGSNTLFGTILPNFGAPAYLVTINTATGAITTKGQTSNNMDAIAFQATPEPGSLLLFLPGLAGLAVVRRRRRK